MKVKRIFIRLDVPKTRELENTFSFQDADFYVLEDLKLYRVIDDRGVRHLYNIDKVLYFSYELMSEPSK